MRGVWQLIAMLTIVFGVDVSPVRGEICQAEYWKALPRSSRCSEYKLPDFSFREIPQPVDAPSHVKRFCRLFEIVTDHGREETGYCYTGEGDRTGPAFTVSSVKYQADLNFVGCIDGEKTEGILFTKGGWDQAPKGIKRLWPVESLPKRPSCD